MDARSSALALAAASNDLLSLEELLSAGADEPALAYALYHASARNRLEAVALLLANGAFAAAESPLGRRQLKGTMPLMAAAYEGHVDVVRVLLQHGASVTEVEDVEGRTALALAAFAGKVECCRALLDAGSDVNAADKKGIVPLHCAAINGNARLAQLLLDAGAVVDARSRSGNTPLHTAASSNSFAVAELLLSRGANVSMPHGDATTFTALHIAAASGYEKMATLLVAHGASLETLGINAAGGMVGSPLQIAAKKGHTATVKALGGLHQGLSGANAVDEPAVSDLQVVAKYASRLALFYVVVYVFGCLLRRRNEVAERGGRVVPRRVTALLLPVRITWPQSRQLFLEAFVCAIVAGCFAMSSVTSDFGILATMLLRLMETLKLTMVTWICLLPISWLEAQRLQWRAPTPPPAPAPPPAAPPLLQRVLLSWLQPHHAYDALFVAFLSTHFDMNAIHLLVTCVFLKLTEAWWQEKISGALRDVLRALLGAGLLIRFAARFPVPFDATALAHWIVDCLGFMIKIRACLWPASWLYARVALLRRVFVVCLQPRFVCVALFSAGLTSTLESDPEHDVATAVLLWLGTWIFLMTPVLLWLRLASRRLALLSAFISAVHYHFAVYPFPFRLDITALAVWIADWLTYSLAGWLCLLPVSWLYRVATRWRQWRSLTLPAALLRHVPWLQPHHVCAALFSALVTSHVEYGSGALRWVFAWLCYTLLYVMLIWVGCAPGGIWYVGFPALLSAVVKHVISPFPFSFDVIALAHWIAHWQLLMVPACFCVAAADGLYARVAARWREWRAPTPQPAAPRPPAAQAQPQPSAGVRRRRVRRVRVPWLQPRHVCAALLSALVTSSIDVAAFTRQASEHCNYAWTWCGVWIYLTLSIVLWHWEVSRCEARNEFLSAVIFHLLLYRSFPLFKLFKLDVTALAQWTAGWLNFMFGLWFWLRVVIWLYPRVAAWWHEWRAQTPQPASPPPPAAQPQPPAAPRRRKVRRSGRQDADADPTDAAAAAAAADEAARVEADAEAARRLQHALEAAAAAQAQQAAAAAAQRTKEAAADAERAAARDAAALEAAAAAAAAAAARPPQPQSQLKECCVCFIDMPAAEQMVFAPCGHRCICEDCWRDKLLPTPGRLCPICDAPVAMAVRVFDA